MSGAYRHTADIGVVEITSYGYALRAVLDSLDRAIIEAALAEPHPDPTHLEDQLHLLRGRIIAALRQKPALPA